MPAGDRATKAPGRCAVHPGNPAVGTCDVCGRAVCLSCAVPVRGQIVGQECLAEVLGSGDAPVAGPDRGQESRLRLGTVLTGLGFVVALVASAVPWADRFSSHASGPFGGWGFHPLSWSLVAALGAALGLGVWAVAAAMRGPGRGWFVALAALAVVVAAGAGLYTGFPPPFTHPRVGPWVAFVGSALALSGSAWAAVHRVARRPRS